jgi:hypothetical protein
LTEDESSLSHIKQYKKRPNNKNCRPRKIAGVFFIGIFVLLLALIGFDLWKNQKLENSQHNIKRDPQKIHSDRNQEISTK